MTAVNWLVSQPWDVFLPLWLGPLALLCGQLVAFAHHRQPPEPEPETVWHMHECGCLCADWIMPCRHHRGRAYAALHKEHT